MKEEFLKELKMDSLIVHNVPKKFSVKRMKENPNTTLEDLILSDVPTTPDKDLLRLFYERIAETIGSSSAFEVEFDPLSSNNPTQQAVRSYFNIVSQPPLPHPENDIIHITQNIAKFLNSVQNAKNPGGILLFIPCFSKDKGGLLILKVEREDGVHIQCDTTESGGTIFHVQHIKDLMLTRKTKLFKVVLFFKNDTNGIVGFVCDKQQGVTGNREIADFFLADFLGCKLKEEPHISTKKFFETVTTYINSDYLKDVDKPIVRTHLISELTNNSPRVNVLDFSRRYLPEDKIQGFMEVMKKNNVPNDFPKDVQLIEKRIKKVKYELESGIKITGTEEAVKNNLSIKPFEDDENEDDRKMKFELIDRIKKVE